VESANSSDNGHRRNHGNDLQGHVPADKQRRRSNRSRDPERDPSLPSDYATEGGDGDATASPGGAGASIWDAPSPAANLGDRLSGIGAAEAPIQGAAFLEGLAQQASNALDPTADAQLREQRPFLWLALHERRGRPGCVQGQGASVSITWDGAAYTVYLTVKGAGVQTSFRVSELAHLWNTCEAILSDPNYRWKPWTPQKNTAAWREVQAELHKLRQKKD